MGRARASAHAREIEISRALRVCDLHRPRLRLDPQRTEDGRPPSCILPREPSRNHQLLISISHGRRSGYAAIAVELWMSRHRSRALRLGCVLQVQLRVEARGAGGRPSEGPAEAMRVLCNGKKLTLRQIGAPVLLVAILTSLCNGQKSQTSQKAADGQQEVPLMLSLEEVYKGKTVMANLASEERCTTCQGRGHVPGPTGAQWPCDKCRGKGTMSTTTQARIIIPRGAPEGGTAMVPTDAGNVRVKFSSKLHKVFRRSGRFDLAHVATLSEAEAEGGFTRRIQLLSGSTLLLTRVGPSAAVDFLPLPGLGMPKGPKDVDGFGELGITFALAPSVLDTGVRTNFAMRSAT